MLKNSKRKFLAFGLAATMSLFVTACGSETSGDAGSNGGTETSQQDRLVVAQNADAVSLDLHASNDSNSSLINVQIFETLVTQDVNMEINPGLATDWRQIDELTWEFDLKEGVTFHNGEPFTADDVYFTLQRALRSPNVAVIVDQIDPDGIEVIDEHTIRISTIQPFAPILSHLAHSATGIMSEVAVTEMEADGTNVGQNPIGTGPFEFVRWQAGDFVELRRFEDYHGDKPVFSELVIRTITEGNNRSIELETGAVDISLSIQAMDRNRIDADDDLQLLATKNLSTTYVGFNLNKEPFDNVLVRQAINYAVNSQAILDHVLDGVGEVSRGPIGANVWGSNTDEAIYEWNLERAKELMAEAGFPDGFSTTIWTSNSATTVDIVTAIAAQLREIGISVEIQQFEWGAYIDALATGDHEMFIMGWGSVTGDADYGLFPLFHSSVPAEAGNRTFFANDRVDELLQQGRSTTDEAERLEIYAEAQAIIVEEAPWIFLVTGEVSAGLQGNIRGFQLNPANHHRFAGVYFE